MIFVSTTDGNIHVFHEDSPEKYSVMDTIKTQYGAKTMGLDSKTHRLFLDTSDFGAPAPAAGGRGGRRAAVLGTVPSAGVRALAGAAPAKADIQTAQSSFRLGQDWHEGQLSRHFGRSIIGLMKMFGENHGRWTEA